MKDGRGTIAGAKKEYGRVVIPLMLFISGRFWQDAASIHVNR